MMQQQQMEDDQRWLEQEENLMVYRDICAPLSFLFQNLEYKFRHVKEAIKKKHLKMVCSILTKIFESDTSKTHNSSF